MGLSTTIHKPQHYRYEHTVHRNNLSNFGLYFFTSMAKCDRPFGTPLDTKIEFVDVPCETNHRVFSYYYVSV